MAPSKLLYDSANLDTLKLQTQSGIHKKTINALAFSPSGKLLASGDDEGRLMVCGRITLRALLILHVQILERIYKANTAILELKWDPSKEASALPLLFVGCANGEIVKIQLAKGGVSANSFLLCSYTDHLTETR